MPEPNLNYERVMAYRPSDIQLVRFVDRRLAEAVTFFGAAYLRGFDVPDHFSRS